MKLAIATAVLSVFSAFAAAQSGGMKGMDMQDHKGMDMTMEKKKKGAGTVHTASGKVTKVDAASSSVTIAHEPVASMNWPAMTMTFKVKDKKMLDKAKSGEKVEFSFVQSGKDYTITDIK
jgi:Cu(I)/Ag(I) efflux system protein CusF